MFVQVYPIVRLPRRFGYFDYSVPEGIKIHTGDLVEVPFKGRTTFAIVRTLTQQSEVRKTIPLKRIVTPFFVQPQDIERIETIARAIIQSPSSIFHACFQGLSSKNTVHWPVQERDPHLRFEKELSDRVQKIVEHIISDVVQPHRASFVQTSQEGSILLAHLLQRKCLRQFLVLVPTEREADIFHSQTIFPQSAVLYGKTKPSVRKSIIESWRNGKIKTLITTRQGALLPAQHIEMILVLDAGSDDYLVTDRNPRIDVRLCADLLAKQHGAKQILCGPVPRTDDLFHERRSYWDDKLPIKLVDLLQKEESTGQALLSESLRKATEEALQNGKKALWFANRKGGAKRLQCGQCGYIPRCGTCHSFPVVQGDDYFCQLCHTRMWIPETCPSCGSKRLKTSGIGIERIAKSARLLFPQAHISLCDKEHSLDPTADIIIATEYYFAHETQPFLERVFSLIADLCVEHHFLSENDRSAESALRKVFRLALFAKYQHANCLIQTIDAARAGTMKYPSSFLEKELATRKTYELSPTCWIWRAGSELHRAKTPQEIETILPLLQSLPDSAIIQSDLPSYDSFRPQPTE